MLIVVRQLTGLDEWTSEFHMEMRSVTSFPFA